MHRLLDLGLLLDETLQIIPEPFEFFLVMLLQLCRLLKRVPRRLRFLMFLRFIGRTPVSFLRQSRKMKPPSLQDGDTKNAFDRCRNSTTIVAFANEQFFIFLKQFAIEKKET